MILKVISFYTNWSRFRKGIGKYSVNDMGPCDVAVYSFAIMDAETYRVVPASENESFTEFVLHCNKHGKKPVIAVGGWVDSTDKYSKMLTSPNNRAEFISSITEFIKQNGFQGLNLDIEYPTCPQANMDGTLADKKGFSTLLYDLKAIFTKYNWELSACIPGSCEVIQRAYDIKVLNETLDWIGLMTYDYNSSSGKNVGPLSSIRDTKCTVDFLLKNGAEKSKLIIGIPFYGHRYKLQSDKNYFYGANAVGPGNAGPCTEEKGVLAYYEIADLIKNGGYNFQEHEDGAFAYKSNDFITFNSELDILKKLELVQNCGAGGVLIWESSMDDFSGKFSHNNEKNPLLSFIWRITHS